jgi:hypothetical protein
MIRVLKLDHVEIIALSCLGVFAIIAILAAVGVIPVPDPVLNFLELLEKSVVPI